VQRVLSGLPPRSPANRPASRPASQPGGPVTARPSGP